jgi:hypothetical protein
VVLEAGVKVTHLRPGDRVWGALPYTNQGTFSELLVLPGKFLPMVGTRTVYVWSLEYETLTPRYRSLHLNCKLLTKSSKFYYCECRFISI